MFNKMSSEKRDILSGYLFVMPAVIFMICLIGYPIIYNFTISFQDIDAVSIAQNTKKFVGLQNYVDLFHDEVFLISFKNTLIYTLASVVFQFAIGFAMALLFSKDFFLGRYLRGFLVVSYIMPITVTALMFKFMLSPSNGVINDLLVMTSIVKESVPWLQEANTALAGVIFTNIWIGVPFNMLILTTGINNIPKELYESANVDGANRFTKFRHVTLPLLRSSILSVLMLGFVYTFKVFDLIYVMTSGGPVNATEVLSTYSYKLSFSYFYFGKGAAVANILFFCLFIVAIFYIRLIKKDEVL